MRRVGLVCLCKVRCHVADNEKVCTCARPTCCVSSLCVCAGPKVLVLTFIHCLKEESVSALTQLIEIGGVKSPLLKKVRAMHTTG